MPWKEPSPRDTSSDQEKGNFSREIWARIKFATVAWTPANVPGTTTVTFLFAESGGAVATRAVIGLRIGMAISITPPGAMPNGLFADCWITTKDTLTVRLSNLSGAPVTPPAGNWAFMGVVI